MTSTRLRISVAAGVLGVAIVGFLIAGSITGDDDGQAEMAPILIEYDDLGAPIAADSMVSTGEAELIRRDDGVTVKADVQGLIADGVYTFWLVGLYEDREFPASRFVNHGKGAVADSSGEANIEMSSAVGDESITGFFIEGLGIAEFSSLSDPMEAGFRVEIVYHGQADDAGDDLDAWMSDFWTGDPDVCANPLGSLATGDVPEHPYCAGYHAASFEAVDSIDP